VRAGILYDTGVYEYDPHEHHGPTLYYAALPFLWLSGAENFKDSSEYPYRLEIVAFGVGLILLLWLLRDALSFWAIFWAGLLMAISPVLVYYSRYFIQETLLIFFAFAAIACGWRYIQKPSATWAVLCGLSLGLVHATKETSILIFAAMGVSLFACLALAHFRRDLKTAYFDRTFLQHAALGLASGIAVSFILYTAFFTHWRGPLDSILTYSTYLSRAEGTGSAGLHDKPWHYYLSMLLYSHREAGPIWSEAFILLSSLLGCVWVIFRRCRSQTITDKNKSKNNYFYLFLSLYSLFLLCVYSLIPYKTPWNLLVFYHPFILLAGLGITSVFSVFTNYKLKFIVFIIVFVLSAHLARLSFHTNFTYPADTRNPHVYAHTSTAIMRLVERLDDLAKIAPEGRDLPIQVFKPDRDYWPLPWYLRQYGQVGFWPKLPNPLPPAVVFITDSANAPALAEALGESYISEIHALRPNVHLVAFIQRSLWETFMETRKNVRTP